MSWSAEEQRGIKRALLGSWPGTITQWGKDAFAAYIGELEARGLDADAVLMAVRTWPAGSDFPPSAPNLAAQARKDPSVPTFEECYQLIYGTRGVLRARPTVSTFPDQSERAKAYAKAAKDRAAELHPLVALFVGRFGVDRLRALEVDHETWGEANRRRLREAWEAHCEAFEDRDVAALASGQRRGEIGKLDPLAALGLERPAAQIEAGE